MRERDPEKRKALIQAFEKRLFEQAYQQPLLWWHRIVPSHKVVMGWKMSPSHNLGADLVRGLARTSERPSIRGPACNARAAEHFQPMLRYTLNRVLLMIPTLIGVAVLVFFMLRIVPGDVVEVKLRGDGGNVSQETIDMERKRLGLDKPLRQPVRRLDGRARDPRSRQVDVDRPAGDRGDRRPPRTVAAGRDHGDASSRC